MNEPVATHPKNRLRELREASNESLERVAVDFDVAKETVANWEKLGIPAKYLIPLARRYGVTVGYLLNDEREAA